MLTAPIAHVGRPPAPHDLWSAWNPDPLVVGSLLVAMWLYQRGRTPGRRPSDVLRARCFWAAMAAVAVALVSPVDRMSTALASAHMVQHVLLVLVAAPLLALSAPASTLLRGSPLVVRQSPGVLRRRLARGASTAALLRQPGAVWLAHVATLWFWHAAVPYDAALASGLIHAVEHGTFLLTGVLFWRTVVGG
ncbi:MAG: cytochrome c oxidase assembly protein, partial [Chloroflexi bacterium]|nr:cytochrome c oxidase assembly protein [Chloroflexota bacterium]